MRNLTRRLEARLKGSPPPSDDRAEILRRASAPAAGIPLAEVMRANVSRGQAERKLVFS